MKLNCEKYEDEYFLNFSESMLLNQQIKIEKEFIKRNKIWDCLAYLNLEAIIWKNLISMAARFKHIELKRD